MGREALVAVLRSGGGWLLHHLDLAPRQRTGPKGIPESLEVGNDAHCRNAAANAAPDAKARKAGDRKDNCSAANGDGHLPTGVDTDSKRPKKQRRKEAAPVRVRGAPPASVPPPPPAVRYSNAEVDDLLNAKRTNDYACCSCDDGADLYDAIIDSSEEFLCPNCLFGVQQCFLCKQDGSCAPRGEDHGGHLPSMRRCDVTSCGRFYHEMCVSSMPRASLIPKSKASSSSECFICPLHICAGCNLRRTKQKGEVIPCRRCPTAYHAACLPSALVDAQPQRVWQAEIDPKTGEGLGEVGASLLYCERHSLDGNQSCPEHERPLFDEELLQRWRLNQSRKHPDLKSSKQMLDARS